MGIDGSNTFNMYENIPLHKRFFSGFSNVLHSKKKKMLFENCFTERFFGEPKMVLLVPKKKKKKPFGSVI